MKSIVSVILAAVVFISVTAHLGASENKDNKRSRLTLIEAQNLFSDKIGGPLEIAEFTTAEVWEKMKLQLFTVRKTIGLSPAVFYILDMNIIYEIGGDFQPIPDIKITDLDKNKYYELFFSFQAGSGRGNLVCYTEGMFLPVSQKLTQLNLSNTNSYVLKKSGATYTIEIHEGEKVIKLGKLRIKKYINGRREVSAD